MISFSSEVKVFTLLTILIIVPLLSIIRCVGYCLTFNRFDIYFF